MRAGMVLHPAEYRWSSYRANAQGEADALVKPHPLYAALGLDGASRQAAYRELFRYELDPGLVDEIRRATNGNFALGNERFAAQVSEALGRRVVPGKPGLLGTRISSGGRGETPTGLVRAGDPKKTLPPATCSVAAEGSSGPPDMTARQGSGEPAPCPREGRA